VDGSVQARYSHITGEMHGRLMDGHHPNMRHPLVAEFLPILVRAGALFINGNLVEQPEEIQQSAGA
jgi:hypothetical protein